jgi:hypothetical protein
MILVAIVNLEEITTSEHQKINEKEFREHYTVE